MYEKRLSRFSPLCKIQVRIGKANRAGMTDVSGSARYRLKTGPVRIQIRFLLHFP